MIYKAYKFKNKDGVEIKVRFYFTGIYTIVDKNGEHELGEWVKKPLLVGRYDLPSKDPHCVEYRARPFEYKKAYSDTSLSELAMKVAHHALIMNRVTV